MQITRHKNELRSERRSPWSAYLFLLAFLSISFIFFTSAAQAELKALSQDELKTSTAQAGLTDFTINNTTARIFLDIHIETHATIENISAGSYIKDVGAGSVFGWDQKWNTVELGTSAESLSIDGLVFRADFNDLSLPDPVLQRIVIGSNRLQGNIAANFASFSGVFNDALTSDPLVAALAAGPDRRSLGNVTFNFNSNAGTDSGLFFILNTSGSNLGIQVVAGYNEHNIPTAPQGPWWNSP